jgi:hypothetical protein
LSYAAYPRRTPGWPLLATLGVHLLLAWGWRSAHPPAPDLRGERVFELIPVPPPVPKTPQLRRQPPSPRLTPVAPPTPSAAPETAREPEPVTAPPDRALTIDDPFAVTTPSTPAESALDAMVGRAKRDAGIIDRDLRKGKPGVPEVADTPWGRFRQALEAAHKDRGLAVTSETYTAPDGQVVYRFRRGGKFKCRSGGSVGPKIGGAVGGGEVLFDVQGGAGRAGEVECPSRAEWKRD